MVIVLFCLSANLSFAQEINIEASVDKTTVALEEPVSFSVTISGNEKSVPEPKLPDLSAFTVYSAGQSQNFTYVDGQVKSSVSFNYVLIPLQEGQLTIAPVILELVGKTFQSSPITILVKRNSVEPQEEKTVPQARSGNVSTRDFFVETEVDKKKAYINEQITLTFRFYQATRLFRNPDYTPPSYTGFWTEDLPPQRQYYKVLDGKRYLVTELKTALFPTQAGKDTIGEASLKVSAQNLFDFFGKDPFSLLDEDLFSAFKQGKPQILKSRPIEIEVLSLPYDKKPQKFSGAVGKFQLKAQLDKRELEVNQPVSFKLQISGNGNVKTFSVPEFPELSEFKIYDAGSSEKLDKSGYVVKGIKTLEKSLLPRKPGNYTIPSVEWSYFDLSAKSYKILKTPAFKLVVKPATADFANPLIPSGMPLDLAVKDIRYIKKSSGRLKNEGGYIHHNPLFILLQLLPLAIFLASWKYRKLLNNSLEYTKARRVYRLALNRLKEIEKLLLEKDSKQFYAEVYKTLQNYIKKKLDLNTWELTREGIKTEVERRNLRHDKIRNFLNILETGELAHFSPSVFCGEQKRSFIESIYTLLKELENNKTVFYVKAA